MIMCCWWSGVAFHWGPWRACRWLDLEGVREGECVRSGLGSPWSRQLLTLSPAAVAEKVRKASILYSGNGPKFKTYWAMLILRPPNRTILFHPAVGPDFWLERRAKGKGGQGWKHESTGPLSVPVFKFGIGSWTKVTWMIEHRPPLPAEFKWPPFLSPLPAAGEVKVLQALIMKFSCPHSLSIKMPWA